MLTIKNLSHPFIGQSKEKPLTKTFKKGSVVFLKGRNGSGKSTFLRILAGLIPKDELMGDFSLYTSISYLGPDFALKNEASVASYQRLNKSDDKARASQLIGDLSSGQKMHLRLKTVLNPDRSLWLLDEPSRFLDSQAVLSLWKDIDDHCIKGGLAIIAHHGDEMSYPFLAPCETIQL